LSLDQQIGEGREAYTDNIRHTHHEVCATINKKKTVALEVFSVVDNNQSIELVEASRNIFHSCECVHCEVFHKMLDGWELMRVMVMEIGDLLRTESEL
ncbi:hypothetical protein MKW98_003392, partial [Papaver atlanticum]